MNYKIWVIIMIISILGFSTAYYFKYKKVYINEVQKTEINNDKGSQLKQLNLRDNIKLLEGLEKTVASEGISLPDDGNRKILKRYKRINISAIASMVLFVILFLGAIGGCGRSIPSK